MALQFVLYPITSGVDSGSYSATTRAWYIVISNNHTRSPVEYYTLVWNLYKILTRIHWIVWKTITVRPETILFLKFSDDTKPYNQSWHGLRLDGNLISAYILEQPRPYVFISCIDPVSWFQDHYWPGFVHICEISRQTGWSLNFLQLLFWLFMVKNKSTHYSSKISFSLSIQCTHLYSALVFSCPSKVHLLNLF